MWSETVRHINAFKAIPPATRAFERRLQNRLADLLEDAGSRVIRDLNQLGRIPSEMERAMILSRIDEVEDQVLEAITDVVGDAGMRSERQSLRELEALGITTPRDTQGLSNQILSQLQERARESLGPHLDGFKKDILRILTKAQAEGLGTADMGRALQEKLPWITQSRAELIARTEVNSAQNVAAELTIQELGVKYHQWWTAEDERVRGNDPRDRADHVRLHGQIVRVGEPFSNGLRYPGDRAGPLYEWINCRCRVVPWIPPTNAVVPPSGYFYEEDVR